MNTLHTLTFKDNSSVVYIEGHRKLYTYIHPNEVYVPIYFVFADKMLFKRTDMTFAQWKGRWGR